MSNTTIETLTLWDSAIKCWESADYGAAINNFSEIGQPSARILFNIGSAQLITMKYDDSVQTLREAIEKDEHLAVAYFVLGCALFRVNRYDEAVRTFEECHTRLRGRNVIDYNQLGLRYKLYACEALHNAGVAAALNQDYDIASEYLTKSQECKVESRHKQVDTTLSSLQRGKTVDVIELPKDCLFRPSKNLLKSITPKDYLGKAKVIAAVDEAEGKIMGFDGPRNRELLNSPEGSPKMKKHLTPPHSTDSSPGSTLERLKKSPLLPHRGKPKSPLIPHKGVTRSPLLPPKIKSGAQSIESGGNKGRDSPITNSPNRSPALLPKQSQNTTTANAESGNKFRSGGFMVKGVFVPPPPSRPPPKLKDKALPSLPARNADITTPPKPPRLVPRLKKEMVSVTLHCHTDEFIQVAHGASLSQLLSEACNKFNMDTNAVDLWAHNEYSGELELIADQSEMEKVWADVKDGQLELWCFGKS